MRKMTFAGALVLGILGGPVAAQPLPGSGASVPASPAAAAEGQRQRYEEIEILGRLLDRVAPSSSAALWQRAKDVAFSPDGRFLATSDGSNNIRLWEASTGRQLGTTTVSRPVAASVFQSVYLRGHGIVYTATLAGQAAKVVGPNTTPTAPPLSDWERTRRELKGEKIEEEKAKQPEEVPLADALLRLLADNGKHLSQLPENESVTVAVTYAPTTRAAADPTTAATDPREVEQKYAAAKEDIQRRIQVGDLHLKQGQAQQAVDAYQQALEVFRKLHDIDRRRGTANVSSEAEVLELSAKLARALAAQGKNDAAQSLLQNAAAGRKPLPDPVKPGAKNETPLSSRLVVTVPKVLLDQVGSGRLSFDQFRKQATVENLTFEK